MIHQSLFKPIEELYFLSWLIITHILNYNGETAQNKYQRDFGNEYTVTTNV